MVRIPLEHIVRDLRVQQHGVISIEEAIGLVKKLDYYSLHLLHSPAADAGSEDSENNSAGDNPEYFLNQDEQPLHYERLQYNEVKNNPPAFEAEEEEYHPPAEDTARELLTTEEATETFVEVQYAAVLHSRGDVNHEERRKLQWWIWMNPVEFKLLEALYSLTREVNYAPAG